MGPDTESEIVTPETVTSETTLEDLRSGDQFKPVNEKGEPSNETFVVLSATSHVVAAKVKQAMGTKLPVRIPDTTRKFRLTQRIEKP